MPVASWDNDIVLKQADSQTSPSPAVDAARQLVESDKVAAVVGSLSSGVTLAVAEAVTVPNKIIQISPASTSPALTCGGGQRLPLPDYSLRRCPGPDPREAGEGARVQQGCDPVRQQRLRAGPVRELRQVLRGGGRHRDGRRSRTSRSRRPIWRSYRRRPQTSPTLLRPSATRRAPPSTSRRASRTT